MKVEEVVNASTGSAQATEQILLCRVSEMLVCIALSHVERTTPLVAIQPMPGSADYVVGMMNFVGHSLPVIDLAMRLDLPAPPYTLDTPILVCVHDKQHIGVMVQNIVGIRTLHSSDQQLTAEFGRYSAAFRASVHTDLGLVLMLDSAWLVNSELYPSRATSEF